jgi:hypothetical protein
MDRNVLGRRSNAKRWQLVDGAATGGWVKGIDHRISSQFAGIVRDVGHRICNRPEESKCVFGSRKRKGVQVILKSMANDGGNGPALSLPNGPRPPYVHSPPATTTDSEQGLSQANRVTEQRHEKEKCRRKKADGVLFVC